MWLICALWPDDTKGYLRHSDLEGHNTWTQAANLAMTFYNREDAEVFLETYVAEGTEAVGYEIERVPEGGIHV